MEMHDICMAAESMREKLVLATAVYVEGHAYRKQGVAMLFTEQGQMIGSISPGCIETDLSLHAENVMAAGSPKKVIYDMRPDDDLSWGENIGCGGLLHILLEPVDSELRQMLSELTKLLNLGHAVTFSRLWLEEEQRVCRYSLRSVTPSLQEGVELRGKVYSFGANQKCHEGEVLYCHTYSSKPRLIVIGAGNDSIPVVRLAQASGFRVLVADWREALCTAERFPNAELFVGFPAKIYESINIQHVDYILLLSHHFPNERTFLEKLQGTPYKYLGILGSRTRTSKLTEGLYSLPHLHAPVGLTIGSEGPEEIAVAIAAELISIKRGKNQGYVAGKEETANAYSRNHFSSRKQSSNG
ncbi:XdhC family protein [Neobacillus mesonae]|nr:XdhC family protein [Neobacillus mesonae]